MSYFVARVTARWLAVEPMTLPRRDVLEAAIGAIGVTPLLDAIDGAIREQRAASRVDGDPVAAMFRALTHHGGMNDVG